jgi:peptidyl-prolyl cis-trans isomerase B (cyclophilin B)
MNNPIIKIILEDEREITAELYPEIAPISVANFLKLIDERYYDGVIFHRVIDRFMIQTGGYYIDGNVLMDKEGANTIKGEFQSNGVENNLKHKLGVLSMARTSDPNSASSQFFICSVSCPHLDGAYAAFGKVIDDEGIKNVLDISHVQTTDIGYGFSDFPIQPIVIKTIEKLS